MTDYLRIAARHTRRSVRRKAGTALQLPGGALDVADQMFRHSRVISQPAVCPPGSAVSRPTGGDFAAEAGRCRREKNPQNCRDRAA